DGRHLILTLDSKIQRILEEYLDGLSAFSPQSRHGALLMEASTGGLIGYAQTPSFDPNNFHAYQGDSFGDLFNDKIAVPDVFKAFLRDLSLLESQAGPGRDLLPWGISAEKRKLGVQLQLWNKLGADGRLDFDFLSQPPADYGAVPFANGESARGNFETVPEMQTPLQVLTAMTRALNGGYKVTPHGSQRFVLRRNQQEFLLEDLNTQPAGGLLPEAVLAEFPKLMEQVGTRGPLGSKFIQGESWSVIESDVERLFHHYLGVVLIPQKDPDLVMLITSTGPGYTVEPKEEFSPAGSAAKIIGQMVALQQVMKNLSDMMSPTIQEDNNFSLSPGSPPLTSAVQGAAAVETEMASLVGMSLRKSLRILQTSNVEIEIQGSGRVVAQHPPAGTRLKPGSRVTLVLERDPVDPAYQAPQYTEPE
ncbi:MAG: PASTA domain-containing protein, partial [Desulfofustis sp.]